jgi:Type VI secretion system, TssO
MIDSMDKAPERAQLIEQQINFELVELNKAIPNDSSDVTKLYKEVILNTNDLVNSKKTMLQLNDSKTTIDKMQQAIDKLEAENKKLYQDYQLATQMNR